MAFIEGVTDHFVHRRKLVITRNRFPGRADAIHVQRKTPRPITYSPGSAAICGPSINDMCDAPLSV